MLKIVIIFIMLTLQGISFVAVAKQQTLPILSGVGGGDFTAIDTDGNTIEFSHYANKVVVMAFGYTNCADICPFTLGYLRRLYGDLTVDEQKKVRIIFVTIDPKYDTVTHLKGFLGHYNQDFIGLTGTKKQIDYIVSLYQAKYKKLSVMDVPTKDIRRVNPKLFVDEKGAEEDKASLYSHTINLYLIDKEGFTRSIEYTGTPVKDFISKIRVLINE